jgi:hypothetical protein
MVGGLVSRTITSVEQDALLLALSVTGKFNELVPKGSTPAKKRLALIGPT